MTKCNHQFWKDRNPAQCFNCGKTEEELWNDKLDEVRADERKKVMEETVEVRSLRNNEKGKSLDYWEGYTTAITRLNKK